MFLRGLHQGALVVYERLPSTHTPCPARAAPVDQDPEEPGAEPLRLLAARQRPIGARERVLERLLRVLPIAHHVHRVAGIPVSLPRDERPVRVHITVQHSGNERGIRAFHTVWTFSQFTPSQWKPYPTNTPRTCANSPHFGESTGGGYPAPDRSADEPWHAPPAPPPARNGPETDRRPPRARPRSDLLPRRPRTGRVRRGREESRSRTPRRHRHRGASGAHPPPGTAPPR